MAHSTPDEYNKVYQSVVQQLNAGADSLFFGNFTPLDTETVSYTLPDKPGTTLIHNHAGSHTSGARTSLHTFEYVDMEPVTDEVREQRGNIFRCLGTVLSAESIIEFGGTTQDGHGFIGKAPLVDNVDQQFRLLYANAREVRYNKDNIDYDAGQHGAAIEDVAILTNAIVGYLHLKGVNEMIMPPQGIR
jgi:hypothetical protein